MPARRISFRNRPDLDQLRHQAKDLLRAIHSGEAEALADLKKFHPSSTDPGNAKLADAQLILARSHCEPSWPRLIKRVELLDAVWDDNLVDLERIIGSDKRLAAMALDQAVMLGNVHLGKVLFQMAGRPQPPDTYLTATSGSLNVEGTQLILDFGARLRDDAGNLLAPISQILETQSRKPDSKHSLLEMYARRGIELPDTPVMAIHRGRIDLLEHHVSRDPALLERTFSLDEIFPPELGCRRNPHGVTATPLEGGTLLHVAAEFAESEITRWLLANGMDVNARASVNENGMGGHSALFSTVVSNANMWASRPGQSPFVASPTEPMTRLLLEAGADPNIRASLWSDRTVPDDTDPRGYHMVRQEHRDVTALSWGRRSNGVLVSETAMKLIEAAGGMD